MTGFWLLFANLDLCSDGRGSIVAAIDYIRMSWLRPHTVALADETSPSYTLVDGVWYSQLSGRHSIFSHLHMQSQMA